MHRIDEAFIEIEPIEAVIHNSLHDETSLQDATLPNQGDLLTKLRNAVAKLDQGAAIYLNQQPPQPPPPALQNTINPQENQQAPTHNGTQPELISNTIDPTTQDDQTNTAAPHAPLLDPNLHENQRLPTRNRLQPRTLDNRIDPTY